MHDLADPIKLALLGAVLFALARGTKAYTVVAAVTGLATFLFAAADIAVTVDHRWPAVPAAWIAACAILGAGAVKCARARISCR